MWHHLICTQAQFGATSFACTQKTTPLHAYASTNGATSFSKHKCSVEQARASNVQAQASNVARIAYSTASSYAHASTSTWYTKSHAGRSGTLPQFLCGRLGAGTRCCALFLARSCGCGTR
eukprot:82726-Pelagomonas_calceolata.AAC.1